MMMIQTPHKKLKIKTTAHSVIDVQYFSTAENVSKWNEVRHLKSDINTQGTKFVNKKSMNNMMKFDN